MVFIEIWYWFRWFSLMIAGNKSWVLVLFDYLDMIRVLFFWYEFDMNLMVKKYDFDRVVLFVDFALRESIGFTGVLWDWWVVNRCVLMCYFIIKYMVFGWIRLKPYFIMVWGDFRLIIGDLWWCWNGEKHWFFKVLSNSVSNSKCGLRRGWNRYAVPGFRLPALKCKLRPLLA